MGNKRGTQPPWSLSLPERRCRICGQPHIFGHTLEQWRAHRVRDSRENRANNPRRQKRKASGTVLVRVNGRPDPLIMSEKRARMLMAVRKAGKAKQAKYPEHGFTTSEKARAAAQKTPRIHKLVRKDPVPDEIIRQLTQKGMPRVSGNKRGES